MSYIDNIVKFHTFSKSTVRENLTLGEAVNPSGHTVTAKQIRTQDIPAFIYSFQTTQEDAEKWAAGNIDAHVRHNDILYWGSQFNMGFEMPNCLIRVAKLEDENGKVIGELPSGTEPYWEPFTLSDKTVLKNSEGDPVITIHKGCKISYVHGDNNAAVNSNKFAAFVKTNDGRLLDHFISPTDQIIGGQPSLGYNLLLFKDGQDKALTEGEELKKDNYIANAYAGIIHFMDERTETYDASKNYEVNGFNVYCYEYTGNKLDSMLTESTAELKDYVDNEINKAIEYRTVNITKGTDNIEIEYKDTTDGDGNPGTYTISVDGYTTSEIDAIKDDINGTLDDHIDDAVIHVTDDDKSRWNEAEELLDEHTNDSTIHVTGNDKSRWDKAEGLLDEHIIDSTMHVTSNDKLRWNEAEELLVEHINDDNKHVTEEDRERWDKGGSAIQSISQGDYINISETNTISVTNVTSNIAESEDSYLTTAASVREYVKDINDNNTISDIIWNLNDLLVSCINDTDREGVKWVQELLRFNANNNANLISIINYESIYNTSDIVEATEKWIAEALAKNTNLSTDLAFRQDSFTTNQLFRLFFYNLDHKFSKTYGSDDSISRKFMKRGLTFKYLAKVEGNPVLNYPNEGFGKPRLKYITLRYRAKTIDGSDKEKEIDWDHIPTIENTVNSGSTADTFQMAKAWDIIDSEEYSTPDSDTSSIIEETISEVSSNWDIETSFTDSATNVSYFKCNSPFSGILTEVRLHCAPAGKTETTLSSYLEIRQNDKILARSINSQEHGQENILRFNFDNILINYNEKYGFHLVNADGTAVSGCLALKKKTEVPEVANLNVEVGGYDAHTPHFGFTYYKSNRKIINSSLDKLDCNLVYDISYNYSNTNNIQSVRNRTITFADGSTTDFPVNKITHAKYAFRTKSNTTPVLTEFNLRDIDGGKPGDHYDEKYYYERDVRKSSYDEDAGGNIETLGNLINGDGMFIRSGITTFNDDLACLIRARQMFTNSQLVSFRSALPSLTFADRMFLGTKLTEFKVKLPNLSSAECMFRLCENLKFVDTCFPNLTFAQGMFGLCNNLERVDLSASSGSNLYLADDMFAGCEKLKTVKINLAYLENAKNMFGPANNKVASLLDIESVKYIANTIKDWNNDYYTDRVHELTLGIDLIHADYETSSYKQYIEQIADKNWKVTVYTSDSRINPAFIVVK